MLKLTLQQKQLPAMFCTEAIARSCSEKKVLLEILQNSQENTYMPESLF